MSSDNGKMVVVCNHADTPHVMPTLIMGASGVGIGDDVILFFCRRRPGKDRYTERPTKPGGIVQYDPG